MWASPRPRFVGPLTRRQGLDSRTFDEGAQHPKFPGAERPRARLTRPGTESALVPDRTMSKAPKEAPKEEAPAEGGAKKKGGNLLVLGLVACNVLSLGGLGAFVMLGGKGEPDAAHAAEGEGHEAAAAEGEAEAPAAEHGEKAEAKKEGHGEAKKEGHGEKKEAPAEHGAPAEPSGKKEDHGGEPGAITSVPLGAFVINLNDPMHPAYLKASLSAELANAELEVEVKSREPQIRDAVISYLSSLTLKETQGPVAKANIRDGVRRRLNNILTSGEVKQVYLTDFVTQ